MKKIKTCPWCGKRPKPKKATKVGEVLACNNKKCALQGFVYSEDTSKLIDLWNNRASPWVSVNCKRKPKGKVLLWVENYGIVAKCYYDEDWYHDLNGKTVCVVDYYGKPTHWMFEPESPILAT